MPVYTTEALARAVAPVRTVIDSLVNEASEEPSPPPAGLRSQKRFVSLLLSISRRQNNDDAEPSDPTTRRDYFVDWSSVDLLPSRRYVRRLVQRFASHLEERGVQMENDDLAALVCHFSTSSRCGGGALPDPTRPCIATFRVPPTNNDAAGEGAREGRRSDILRIRTYPHHNGVGVARVWEAGACLAEFLMHDPKYVSRRNVVELGAGVGLTGLVAAGVARARSVHMTDYTQACLENLAHNVNENGSWLMERNVSPDTVTVVRNEDGFRFAIYFAETLLLSQNHNQGRLEWGEYSNMRNGNIDAVDVGGQALGYPWASSIEALSTADVLLAADVVYDVDGIPDLVATVCKFLRQTVHHSNGNGDERVAIFATTYRNKNTFDLFEKELEEKHIFVAYHSLECLPDIFPCYFNQPRSDVRVCTMRMKCE